MRLIKDFGYKLWLEVHCPPRVRRDLQGRLERRTWVMEGMFHVALGSPHADGLFARAHIIDFWYERNTALVVVISQDGMQLQELIRLCSDEERYNTWSGRMTPSNMCDVCDRDTCLVGHGREFVSWRDYLLTEDMLSSSPDSNFDLYSWGTNGEESPFMVRLREHNQKARKAFEGGNDG